jgi:hypothetical protein
MKTKTVYTKKYVLRFTVVLEFVHCPGLKTRTQCLGNWMSPPSGEEGKTLTLWIPQKELTSITGQPRNITMAIYAPGQQD